jgi:hypothetical protein
VNDALLSELAIQGKGPYHFIDSAQEMDKVFRKDALGLMAKVAANVAVTIRPEPGVQPIQVTGYEGSLPSGPVQVSLRDLAPGDSQVLLVLRFARMPQASGLVSSNSATMAEGNKHETWRQHTDAQAEERRTIRLRCKVPELAIQRSAEGLKEISRLANERRYEQAWRGA